MKNRHAARLQAPLIGFDFKVVKVSTYTGATHRHNAQAPHLTEPQQSWAPKPSAFRRVAKASCCHAAGGRQSAVLRRCREAGPGSPQLANSVINVNVAGAYMCKGAYRRSERDSSPPSIGARNSRETATQSRTAGLAMASAFTDAERCYQARSSRRTASWPSARQVRTCGK